ncbi:MAG: hypothetical protein AAB492_03060 [Patescibacteria group bacterium]
MQQKIDVLTEVLLSENRKHIDDAVDELANEVIDAIAWKLEPIKRDTLLKDGTIETIGQGNVKYYTNNKATTLPYDYEYKSLDLKNKIHCLIEEIFPEVKLKGVK